MPPLLLDPDPSRSSLCIADQGFQEQLGVLGLGLGLKSHMAKVLVSSSTNAPGWPAGCLRKWLCMASRGFSQRCYSLQCLVETQIWITKGARSLPPFPHPKKIYFSNERIFQQRVSKVSETNKFPIQRELVWCAMILSPARVEVEWYGMVRFGIHWWCVCVCAKMHSGQWGKYKYSFPIWQFLWGININAYWFVEQDGTSDKHWKEVERNREVEFCTLALYLYFVFAFLLVSCHQTRGWVCLAGTPPLISLSASVALLVPQTMPDNVLGWRIKIFWFEGPLVLCIHYNPSLCSTGESNPLQCLWMSYSGGWAFYSMCSNHRLASCCVLSTHYRNKRRGRRT